MPVEPPITPDQLQRIRCSVALWAAAHDEIEEVILVGSYAWGVPTEESDVDLLVIAPVEKLMVGRMYDGWEETLTTEIGIKTHILSGAVPFVERGHDPKRDGVSLYRRTVGAGPIRL